MIRMTHLIWRNGRACFRYRLPSELRAIPKPTHWPEELKELVSDSRPSQLKHELSKALSTRDERVAKKAAAVAIVWAEELVQRGLAFLKDGPKATLTAADIELMAERYGAELVTGDMDMRKAGLGLNLPKWAISALSSKTEGARRRNDVSSAEESAGHIAANFRSTPA